MSSPRTSSGVAEAFEEALTLKHKEKKSRNDVPAAAAAASINPHTTGPPQAKTPTNVDLVARTFPDIFDEEENDAQRSDPLPLPSPDANVPDGQPGAFPMRGALPDSGGSVQVLSEVEEQRRRSTPAAIHASLVKSALNVVEDDYRDEDDRSEALEGIPLPDKPQASSVCTKSKLFKLGLLMFWMTVLITLILVLTLEKGNDTDTQEATSESNVTATVVLYPPFDDKLYKDVLRDIREDPTSPGYKANKWMWEDPHLDTYPKWRQFQRFRMVIKYYSTQGDHWFHNDHWLSYEVHECEWWSRDDNPCNEKGELVVDDLHSNNLNGPLPAQPQLTSVLKVDTSNNHLHGTIPPTDLVEHIEIFIMANNSLAGPLITFGTFSAPNLRVIQVENNQLEGSSFGAMLAVFPSLEYIDFTGNRFAGKLPSNVDSCPNLSYIGLGGNLLSGSIPTELGLLTWLQWLDISHNPRVTGTIPTELGVLDSLFHLDVVGTSMTGKIPQELCGREEELLILANCSEVECCA